MENIASKAEGILCPACSFRLFRIAQMGGNLVFQCSNCAYTLQCGLAIAGPEIKKPEQIHES